MVASEQYSAGDSSASSQEEPIFERPILTNSSAVSAGNAWDPRHLEYGFKVGLGTGSKQLLLDASQYKEDHLDWYSFTVKIHLQVCQ